MKKTTLLLLVLLLSYATFAQTGGFNYKALLVDNGTALNTQSVTLKFTVLENGTTAIYQETQTATTDANGIVSVSIGEGTVISGTFSTIDWGSNPQFLKVEIDTGSGFTDFGTSEFKTIPYAKYADKAGNAFSGNFVDLNGVPTGLADGDDVNDADHSTTNELQTLTFDNSTRNLTILNGNTVTIPTDSDGWGTQVAKTNSSINGDGTSANPLGVNTSDAIFSGWDKNVSDDFDGNFTHLTNVPAGLADGDDNTQLTEAQVDNYVSNNGYLTTATLPDQTDDDFYKVGTTSPSTNINDNIFHKGQLAIGKETFDSGSTNGDAQLEILSENTADPSYALRIEKIADESWAVGVLRSEATYNGSFSFVGYSNHITGTGTGRTNGMSNYINVPNDNNQIVIVNSLSSSGLGNRIGVSNEITSGSETIKGVYNFVRSSGNGIQIGIHSELNGGNGKHYGTLNHLYGSGTGIQYGTVNHIENTGSANHFGTVNDMAGNNAVDLTGTHNYINGTATGALYGEKNEFSGATEDGNKYGVYTSIDNDSGDGLHYGIYNELEGSGSGKHIGVNNSLTGNGTGILGGISNNISGTASTMQYGVSNQISGSGSGMQYGIINQINNSNDNEHYASYNLLNGAGSGDHYGNYTWLTGSGVGDQIGSYIKHDGTGTARRYGTKTEITSTSGWQYGNYVHFDGESTKPRYANYTLFTGAGSTSMGMFNYFNNPGGLGTKWGVNNQFTINTNAAIYGFYNTISGTGLGSKYGVYSYIGDSTGGTHYGVYSRAEKSGSYAGYFVGSMAIDKNSVYDDAHLTLTETGDASDGARMMFANAEETDNVWTLWGKADDTSDDGRFNFHYTGTGNIMTIKGNGQVGINRDPVTNALEVNGNASKSTAGSWLGNSDRRLKTNINTIDPENALRKIRMLRGVTYEWNDNKTGNTRPTGVQYGFIAQEIMEVFPSKVSKDNLGYYQTAYGDPLFVQAIKALDKKVEEVEKLKNEVNELKARLDKLEKIILNSK